MNYKPRKPHLWRVNGEWFCELRGVGQRHRAPTAHQAYQLWTEDWYLRGLMNDLSRSLAPLANWSVFGDPPWVAK